MTPQNFVSKVRLAVLQENADIDRDLFESTTLESARDPYWKRALTLYRSLSDADRAVLYEIMRQVRVDTVAELFCILDGACVLEGPHEDFVLTSQPDNQRLNGDLADLFLEAEENERQ